MRVFFIEILFFFQFYFIDAIYNGTKANRHQFPHAVIVHRPGFFCSGSLISDQHVLTAAHCLRNMRRSDKVRINVGAHEYYGAETIYSNTFWMHENFSMPSAVHDIGIVKLPQPLIFSNKIQPIKISTKINVDLDADDREVYTAGWGYFREYSGPSDELKYTKMNLIPLEECKTYKSHYIEDLNENHICSKMTEGMPCSGDSGASLISVKTNKIVGILSYVKDAENGIDIQYNDCRSNVPAVSTRISSYLNWISDKTGIDFSGDNDNNEISENSLK